MRIIGLAGWSGSGKTTLLTRVIPRLVARGLTVSTLKHAHHGFDVDQPGKDSHSHRMAGATEVLIAAPARCALVHELRGDAEPTLQKLLALLSPVDLVIVEGYKAAAIPKLEVHRAAVGKPLLHPADNCIVAVASDVPLPAVELPVVSLPTISTPSRTSSSREAAVRSRMALERGRPDGAALRRLLRVRRPAAAGRRNGAADRGARRAGCRNRDGGAGGGRAAAWLRKTCLRRSTCRRSTIRRWTATPCATPTSRPPATRG